jgi:hypothetical protein
MDCLMDCPDGMDHSQGDSGLDLKSLLESSQAAYSDGINTGFYINSYTTKHCPTMDGVLDEMRTGLERLQEQREAAQEAATAAGLTRARSKFGQVLDVLKRLSALYRRCYWKSGAEMLFPILFGHMTFASHRCWTVFVKKGIFLAAEAWRSQYGRAVRHAALTDGGGAILQFKRDGYDPEPLPGWREVKLGDEGAVVYEGPNGELFDNLLAAYDYFKAQQCAQAGVADAKLPLTFLQKFLNECCSEKEHREEGEQRIVITTSTLEDWLHRGQHPILAPMSLYVYAMWVFRIERPAKKARHRFIDIEFVPTYALRNTHLQRLASDFRVPLFEGFTMPSGDADSETAALYKQVLLRPLAVEENEDVAPDLKLIEAFAPTCVPASNNLGSRSLEGRSAFTRNWEQFAQVQEGEALQARAQLLDRYEWPSLHETQEVYETFHGMYMEDLGDQDEAMIAPGDDTNAFDPEYCHDRAKPRVSMAQYVALVGMDVAENLEGIARARMDKKPRHYQSAAAIHQAYMQVISAGGDTGGDGDVDDIEPVGVAPKEAGRFFEPVPLWGINSVEGLEQVLDFGHRIRLTPFAKGLLELPCMKLDPWAQAGPRMDEGSYGAAWRSMYARNLSSESHADEMHLVDLVTLQTSRLDVNRAEDEPDVLGGKDDQPVAERGNREAQAGFSAQDVYRSPSAYIRILIEELPQHEKLTRDQTLFMVRFEAACDAAWEDEQKPPDERRVHHLLLLGQGGSGKTHVVQKLVFTAVEYIWPSAGRAQKSLMVVASSNAQAKNISTREVKARTIHNAAAMRIQELINPKMRPGKKQNQLTRLWDPVRVLVIEEVSMVAASWYNMLGFRSMLGRSRTYGVTEGTYRRPNHHFGRIPIVIHLGDFLQLSPTANIGLVEDLNAKQPDGSYKYKEPPSLEIQNAIKLFKSIPHVFEFRGTKRFHPGDPIIEFLNCMRAGRRIPQRVWKAFERTFATDGAGVLDPRHTSPKFSQGYGMSMYWETLARWQSRRARRDARSLGVPLVFLQAVDECNTIDASAAQRLLNVPNHHNTGHIHGVLAGHAGMRVRFATKMNSTLGLVQEQRATIVTFVFKHEDQLRYDACAPGEIFRPRYLPAGIWLQVDDFVDSPIWEEAYFSSEMTAAANARQ